jgi:hypothetical protein
VPWIVEKAALERIGGVIGGLAVVDEIALQIETQDDGFGVMREIEAGIEDADANRAGMIPVDFVAGHF